MTALAMLPTFSAFAADRGDKVEISFKVGDSALTVNGETLDITAPYVVGDGTTLVPVRVITEAFGAEVDWDGTAQSVTLVYPDVDMTIKIGSKSATVNTHTETLEAAPELYNDTTMVPLRFISEAFGAKVTYDDETRLITVTKETVKEEGTKVEGTTDKEYIGDSYYGWTIKNPKGLTMTDRDFSGYKTSFSDGVNKLNIYVGEEDETIDVSAKYNELRNLMSSGAISVADKKSLGNGVTTIHFRAKDKKYVYDISAYISGKKYYELDSYIDVDSSSLQDFYDIIDSFAISGNRDYYDISNVKDGYRSFSDDEYKFSLNLPAEWEEYKNQGANYFRFYDPEESQHSVLVTISSKNDETTAQSMAENDRQNHVDVINKNLAEISDIQMSTVAGKTAYYYTVQYKGSGQHSYYMRDCFVEIGEYIYNISAATEDEATAQKIIQSFNADELDADKMGTLLRTDDLGENSKVTLDDAKATVSSKWLPMKIYDKENDDETSLLCDTRTGGSIIAFSKSKSDTTPDKAARDYANYVIKQKGGNILDAVKFETGNGHTVYYQTVKYTEDDGCCIYVTIYTIKERSKIYYFAHIRSDIYYGGTVDDEVHDLMLNLEF